MNSVKQPIYKPTQKLVCDLTNKQKYMIHYRMFKFYTKMGMKVTHIHTIYRFKQSPWLAKYIDYNTQKRTKAKTNFEKDLYKLSETTSATNYSIRFNLHNLSVEKQNKLALNPFDDKPVYLNPIQSLSWDKHTQKGDCPCIYCLKFIGLYYNGLSTRDGTSLRDEEIYYNIWTLKKKLNHQDLLNLKRDRAHLL